jgi:glycosyltransferase involved in cell wall biosynthesis
LRNPDFAACDLAIFHWGIYYGSFDAITVLQPDTAGVRGPGPLPVVHFHNCTPLELVPPAQHDSAQRSFHQIAHAISLGVPLWTYSEFNRLTLLAWGAAPEQIAFVPFPIEAPATPDSPRPTDRVELLTVGRLVPAKGVDILVEAIGLLASDMRRHMRLRIVGAELFSDADFIERLRALAEPLGANVEFILDASDDDVAACFATSHVVVSPSLHEGLCVPVIEGYLAGRRAVATTAGNLAYLLVDGDEQVPPADAPALAAALTRTIDEVRSGTEPDAARRAAARAAVAARFSIDSSRHYLAAALAGRPSAYDDSFHADAHAIEPQGR